MEDMVSLAALPWWDVPVVSCIVWCSLGCGRAWPSYVVLTVAVRRGPRGAGALGVQSRLAGRLLLDLPTSISRYTKVTSVPNIKLQFHM